MRNYTRQHGNDRRVIVETGMGRVVIVDLSDDLIDYLFSDERCECHLIPGKDHKVLVSGLDDCPVHSRRLKR